MRKLPKLKAGRNPGPVLLFQDFDQGHPGISKAIAECYAEAASLCLEDQGHSSGVALKVQGFQNSSFVLDWKAGDQRKDLAWDRDDATECGACCIAIVLICRLTGLRVIERAQKGTRVDYWLGTADDDEPPFSEKSVKARLEVSGIRRGTPAAVRTRLGEKLDRLRLSQNNLAAYVVIVEFSEPMSEVELEHESNQAAS